MLEPVGWLFFLVVICFFWDVYMVRWDNCDTALSRRSYDIIPEDWNGKIMVFAGGLPGMSDLVSQIHSAFPEYRFIVFNPWEHLKGGKSIGPERHASDLLEFLDQKLVYKVNIMIAYSFAGVYAFKALEKDPGRFDQLVCMSVPGLTLVKPLKYAWTLVSSTLRFWSDWEKWQIMRLVAFRYLYLFARHFRQIVADTKYMISFKIADHPGEKVVFFHFENDELFPWPEAARARPFLKQLKGPSHFFPFFNPRYSGLQIAAFIGRQAL